MRNIFIKTTKRFGLVLASLAFVVGSFTGMAVPAVAASGPLDDIAYEVSRPDKNYSFVTTSLQEVEDAKASGFTLSRPIFMVSTTPGAGLSPIYRTERASATNFISLLTPSKREYDNASLKYGYTGKGIAFYAPMGSKTVPGSEMILRMKYVSGSNFRFVLPADKQDLLDKGYIVEGNAWFYSVGVPVVEPHAPPTPPSDVEPVGDGKFAIAVYPDTQQEVYPFSGDQFAERTNWTVNSKNTFDLRFVAHTGDMVSSGGNADVDLPTQFIIASNAFTKLDQASMPYLTSIGNHDTKAVCGGGGACDPAYTNLWARDTTVFNSYFSSSRQNLPDSQLFEPGKVDNAYKTFTAEGKKWLILTLELWPRVEAINWAKQVVSSHPNHNVIVTSHSLLNSDGTIKTTADYGIGKNSPRYLYDNLLLAYPNIKMAFCGHTGKAVSREDTGVNGNKVTTFLGTFHENNYNPIRIVTIDTVNNTVVSNILAASIRDDYKAAYPNSTLKSYSEYDVSYDNMNYVTPN